ncbi:hypothetical protein VMUT_2126 [Vulcanisaeta moutnovskia 768-28]|uniref:Uncharacterized protein n=1 Tax=Vulcanisaeta moutnovskia (strain 768-28) TaxID=985053 RepID=F0QX34_VULM7|nr:hypothetical protein [Vulcanisaeta moutnovskia]ADY02323.1 hypothetical protein VMUT_2126 [Vulcanisaeta moutnovskia 768-28]
MADRHNKGQGLLIIAMIIVIAALILAMLYRIFTMTPAYVYQRSIYFAFKMNPQIIVQQLGQLTQGIVETYAINYSNFLITQGIILYLHALTQSPVPYSLGSLIITEISILVNSIYVPTGIAIPTARPKPSISVVTGFYGALNIKGINYIYSGGNESSIAILLNTTYNMPTLGIQHLTLNNGINLTAWITPPSTCEAQPQVINITTEVRCIFNFKYDNYTCTGPSIYSTGNANYLWAPLYTAFPSNEYRTRGQGWVAEGGPYPLVFVLPIDELAANSGFKISAVFNVTQAIASNNNYEIGVQVLGAWPGTLQGTTSYPSTGYSVIVQGSSGSNTPSISVYAGDNDNIKCGTININQGLINVTIYVKPTSPITWQNIINSQPTAQLYVNGVYCTTIYLPSLIFVPNTVFGNDAYMLSGIDPNHGQEIGSWTALILQNAAVINASIKLYNTYQLPSNVYVAVSANNQPALGTIITGLNITPVIGPKTFNANYTVCNITSNAVVFNIAMPKPKGYPNTQYLLIINYSNVRLILNPWSPSALETMGINPTYPVPNGYSATSLIPYMAYIYNETSGFLIIVTYFINTGIPTLLTIYSGLYMTQIIESTIYTTLGFVKPLPFMNILKVDNISPMGTLSIFSFNETAINLAPGYMVVGQVIPSTETESSGFANPNNPYPSSLYNWITGYEHFPNQTLPYTYFYPTIMNCYYYNQNNQNYINSYIYFSYEDNQLLYNGYTQYNLGSCQGW